MPQTYGKNMRKAAERHYDAAAKLNDSRADVAGYLFGLAAECALKELMIRSGMQELPREERSNDPFYAHFEALKAMVRDKASGQLTAQLRRISERNDLMQHWDIAMRYSDGRDIDPNWITRWREDAKELLHTMRELA